ncbi:MAG: response regulator [Acidobacteriaceae bacterium]|nr:response regulator [Acidobacteriaceae bacterium]
MKLIIVVDDNESLASSVAIALARIPGIEVATANHPARALSLIAERAATDFVAALITDYNLPSVNGLELIHQARAIDRCRSLPAILMTGDDALLSADGSILDTPNAILRKPFSMKEVRRVVEELLD